jgi:selenium metabolism protein YedF
MVRFSGRRFLFLKIEGVNLMTTDNRHLATGTVLFLGSDIIGRGESLALGNLLMQSFLHTMGGLEGGPEIILLMNNGVKLVTQESPVLGELKQLESQGTEILACGTCLARFELTDKIAVGKVSNMYEITGKMLKADRVISL